MSVARNYYSRFLRLTQSYPVNPNRPRSDFGKFVRDPALAKRFSEQSEVEQEATVDALSKLSSSYYKDKYPRMSEHAYSKVSKEELRQFLDLVETEEYQESMRKQSWIDMFKSLMQLGDNKK